MRYAYIIICTTLMLAGCGGGPKDTPSLGDVSGKVTYHDVPVEGISVIFTAVDGTSRSAQGTTDEDGNYKLLFNSGNTGAPVGKNSVELRKQESDEMEAEAEAPEADDGGDPPKTESVVNDVPPKFYSPFTEFDVQPGSNTLDLKLETFE